MVMADFIFRVASVKLTDAQQQKIATAIQGAVLTELAQLDLGGGQSKTPSSVPAAAGGAGEFLYLPHNWRGGYLIAREEAQAAASTVLSVTSSKTAA
jgi:hypothetical protein